MGHKLFGAGFAIACTMPVWGDVNQGVVAGVALALMAAGLVINCRT